VGVEFTSIRVDTEKALAIVRARSPILPFIILTGALNEDTAVAFMKAEASDYVIKGHLARLPFAVLEAMDKRNSLELAERRKAEITENEARYRAFFNDSNAIMCLVESQNQTILYVNKAACEFYG